MLSEAINVLEAQQESLERENKALKAGMKSGGSLQGLSKGPSSGALSAMGGSSTSGAGHEALGSGPGQQQLMMLEVQSRLLVSWRNLATRRLLQGLAPLPAIPHMPRHTSTASEDPTKTTEAPAGQIFASDPKRKAAEALLVYRLVVVIVCDRCIVWLPCSRNILLTMPQTIARCID